MNQKNIEKILEQAVRNGEAMLIEGGSTRIGFTQREAKTMAQVIYDDLVSEGVLKESSKELAK